MEDILQIIKKLPKRKIKKIISDPTETAVAISLVYVNDGTHEGIRRKKRGKSFSYIYQEKPLKAKDQLSRIKSLVIPPSWENVWICAFADGHLQATGMDARNRKQYRYHPKWNEFRNQTKFYRLLHFGEVLPKIRLQVEKDLSLPGMPRQKILAAVISLMQRTNIRVGNNMYEKLYGSFGLTTLKDKHVEIKGSQVKFCFKGKKGIMHDIDLKNKKLANIVQQCKDIPGKELFQYYDEQGERRTIDSGMVNDYIRQITGEDFTAKDFRTWSGTLNAFLAFKELGLAENDSAAKKNVVAALDKVAATLGNTRTVCKKYYVHPVVVSLYESNSIEKYFAQLDAIEKDDDKAGLTGDERILMKILNQPI